jgi:hypothetical protein
VNYTQFSQAFLVAAYHESELFENRDITAGQLLGTYDPDGKPGWAGSVVEEFAQDGLMENDPTLGDEAQLSVILKGKGIREAERLIDVGLKVRKLSSFSDGTTFSDGSRFATELPIASEPQAEAELMPVESSGWTGLPSDNVLSEDRRVSLQTLLTRAEADLDALGIGNAEKALARAYIIAARALADAPEPPVDLIWQIICRANNVAGIASLFVSIIALLNGAAH